MDGAALVLIAAAAALVVLHHESCRRWLLRGEDPRTMATFRIAVGLCTIGWTLDLWPLLDYLFSDEGLFTTDVARQVFVPKGFAGIADGSAADEPAGALDAVAVLQLLASPRHSLLFVWDSPAAVQLHVLALLGAAVLLTLGLGTAVTKWIMLLLFHSLTTRNSISGAGEQVFLNFMLLLCCSRCGHAYGLDALLRARRGLAGVPAEIPAWPRALALLQLIPLFTANGLAKTGAMWAAGDTFHYMLLHPDFHRFDPSALAVLFSTNLFRVMTWVTHAFELMFPLAIIGMVLRFQRRAGIAALAGARRLAARLLWLVVAIAMTSSALLTLEGRERATLCFAVLVLAAATIVVLALVGDRLRPLRLGRATIDLDWICRWVLGRRIWVTALLLFTGHLVLLTNLGWFVVLTLATAILFFDGEEIAGALARLRRGPRAPSAASQTSSSTSDAAVLPAPALPIALAVLFAGAVAAALSGVAAVWPACVVVVVATLALVARRGHAEAGVLRDRRRRFMAGWFCAFHVTAVALVLLPADEPRSDGRVIVEAPFRRWLEHAHATQWWQMFAPAGPRTVSWLEVDVTEADGHAVAIGSGIPAPTAVLGLGRDKHEKIARRIVGEGGASWYAKWHGRYVCRRSTLAHDAVAPTMVELWRGNRPIASPRAYGEGDRVAIAEIEAVRDRELVWSGICADEVHGQPVGAPDFRGWEKPRAQKWAELRASGEMPDLPWPLAIFGVPWLVLAVRAGGRSRHGLQDRHTQARSLVAPDREDVSV